MIAWLMKKESTKLPLFSRLQILSQPQLGVGMSITVQFLVNVQKWLDAELLLWQKAAEQKEAWNAVRSSDMHFV